MTAAPPDDPWNDAPAGLLTLGPDGTIVAANPAFLAWVGSDRADVEGRVRLVDLLTVGGRIFWETHLFPLLHVEGRVEEVALELRGAAGRLPVLLTAGARADGLVLVALSSARERSRYERELLAARAAAERSESRLGALQAVTAALSGATGVDAVGRALLAAAVGPLGAGAATLWLLDPERGLLAHGSEGETEPPEPPHPARVALQGGSPAQDGGRVVVPLPGQSALRGVLSLAERLQPTAEPMDLEVLTAVGQQGGLALDRAAAYERNAGVARELQQSLLATEPPQDERYAVATVYRPGVETLEVGGDWHDVFLVGDGLLAVVVGDVVGRGLGAASAMGQLRSAVRAVAAPDLGPARLLSRLDHFVEQVDAAAMATVAYAELDLDTGRVRYACAGHPPPVLLPADAAPLLLWDGRSTPLGAFVQPRPRSEAVLHLAPGDRLLLYTDGLVERRDRGLDEGLEILRDTAAGLGGLALGEAVAGLTSQLLVDERGRDDVCVLLLSWFGAQFEQHVPADLRGLSAVRSALRGWLQVRGVGRDAVDDLVLAASEAVANAAEHGVGLRPDARVRLRARVEPQAGSGRDVVVTVQDRGSWRSRAPSAERGRGLRIMRSLVDDVRVEVEDGTTVVLRRAVEAGRP